MQTGCEADCAASFDDDGIDELFTIEELCKFRRSTTEREKDTFGFDSSLRYWSACVERKCGVRPNIKAWFHWHANPI